jgi:hypothetical protein
MSSQSSQLAAFAPLALPLSISEDKNKEHNALVLKKIDEETRDMNQIQEKAKMFTEDLDVADSYDSIHWNTSYDLEFGSINTKKPTEENKVVDFYPEN